MPASAGMTNYDTVSQGRGKFGKGGDAASSVAGRKERDLIFLINLLQEVKNEKRN